MGQQLRPEERVLQAAGLTPALVEEFSTEVEMINDRQALIHFTGVKLVMDSQLDNIKKVLDEYEKDRERNAPVG